MTLSAVADLRASAEADRLAACFHEGFDPTLADCLNRRSVLPRRAGWSDPLPRRIDTY